MSTDNTSTLTITNAGINVLTKLDRLSAEQNKWSTTVYKNAQDKLLSMLAECLEAYNVLAVDHEQRKSFAKRLKELRIKMREGTDLSTLIVRYVFCIKGSRMQAYARVIRAAAAIQKEPKDLAAWVTEQGGIEAVRAPRSTEAKAVAERSLDGATTALEHVGALLTIDKPSIALKPGTNSYGMFTLALVRQNNITGAGEVVWASDNASLVKAFITRHSKQMLEKHDAEVAAETAPSRRAALQDAIYALPAVVADVAVAELQAA